GCWTQARSEVWWMTWDREYRPKEAGCFARRKGRPGATLSTTKGITEQNRSAALGLSSTTTLPAARRWILAGLAGGGDHASASATSASVSASTAALPPRSSLRRLVARTQRWICLASK